MYASATHTHHLPRSTQQKKQCATAIPHESSARWNIKTHVELPAVLKHEASTTCRRSEAEHERSTQASFTSLQLTINKYDTNTRKRGRPKRTASFLTTVLGSHYMLHDSTTADSHELIPRRTTYRVACFSIGTYQAAGALTAY